MAKKKRQARKKKKSTKKRRMKPSPFTTNKLTLDDSATSFDFTERTHVVSSGFVLDSEVHLSYIDGFI